jgi:hypothetical protein
MRCFGGVCHHRDINAHLVACSFCYMKNEGEFNEYIRRKKENKPQKIKS